MTADELAAADHHLLLLDPTRSTIATLSRSEGDEIAGRVLAPFPRAVWLQPQFCRMPRRHGGGGGVVVAARLALMPGSLDPEVQVEGDVRPTPFATVEGVLRCLEVCLLGVLHDEEVDDDVGGEEAEQEGEKEGDDEMEV